MIYLDNNATTPLDPEVLKVMLPYMTQVYGNASSRHSAGRKAKLAVDEARYFVTDLIGAKPKDVVFTSGATEAINIGVKGIALSKQNKGKHIITCQTEHAAILETCRYLETIGFSVTYVSVDSNGLIDLEEYKQSFRPDTIMAGVMLVNNETGVIQPIAKLSEIAHEHDALFFSDITQAVGKVPLEIGAFGIDLAAFSAHKIHGPKGVGALYCRSLKIAMPLLHGGGQERGIRSGTYNVPGIVGFGKAAAIASERMYIDRLQLTKLQSTFERSFSDIPAVKILAQAAPRIHTTSSICCKGYLADVLIPALDPIIVSNGSACTSENIAPSHVIKAMGLSDDDAFATIRVSYGRFNREADVLALADSLSRLLSSS